jgi:hypothetical protein
MQVNYYLIFHEVQIEDYEISKKRRIVDKISVEGSGPQPARSLLAAHLGY